MLLVGDSLGMVMLGHEDALSGRQWLICSIMQGRLTRCKKVLLFVADLPFLSYHISTEAAVINTGRLIQEGGANAVKLGVARLFPMSLPLSQELLSQSSRTSV